MIHYEAIVCSKGRITVQVPVREFLELRTGEAVDSFFDQRTRAVRMRARNRPLATIFGRLNKYIDPNAAPMTAEQIEPAIGDQVAEDAADIMLEHNEWQEFQRWKHNRRQGGG